MDGLAIIGQSEYEKIEYKKYYLQAFIPPSIFVLPFKLKLPLQVNNLS